MNKCDHEDIDTTGKMQSTPIDSVYVIPCKCNICGDKVYEKYYYEGVIEDKNNPEEIR